MQVIFKNNITYKHNYNSCFIAASFPYLIWERDITYFLVYVS